MYIKYLLFSIGDGKIFIMEQINRIYFIKIINMTYDDHSFIFHVYVSINVDK